MKDKVGAAICHWFGWHHTVTHTKNFTVKWMKFQYLVLGLRAKYVPKCPHLFQLITLLGCLMEEDSNSGKNSAHFAHAHSTVSLPIVPFLLQSCTYFYQFLKRVHNVNGAVMTIKLTILPNSLVESIYKQRTYNTAIYACTYVNYEWHGNSSQWYDQRCCGQNHLKQAKGYSRDYNHIHNSWLKLTVNSYMCIKDK